MLEGIHGLTNVGAWRRGGSHTKGIGRNRLETDPLGKCDAGRLGTAEGRAEFRFRLKASVPADLARGKVVTRRGRERRETHKRQNGGGKECRWYTGPLKLQAGVASGHIRIRCQHVRVNCSVGGRQGGCIVRLG